MKFIYSILIFLTTISFSNASMSSGTIDPAYKTTKICQDIGCGNVTSYTLNMAPSGVTQVTVDDTNGLDGVAWGSSIGWITLDPSGPEGVTIDANTGVLSGKAWAQGSGWVNFSVTNHQVAINNNGEFSGWAWTGGVGGGWIKFDCTDPFACIKTDWRPIPARSTTTPVAPVVSSGGIISSYTDVCPNLPDQQYNVPAGYGLSSGVCSLVDDKCSNLPGAQSAVPSGYESDKGGLCILKALDMCPNINGNQSNVPLGQTINAAGDCVTQKVEDETLPVLSEEEVGITSSELDMCLNILGLQLRIPDGMTKDNNESCVPDSLDYCPNINGVQSSVPSDLVVDNGGNCVPGLTKIDINPIITNNSISAGNNRYVLPLTPSAEGEGARLIVYPFMPDSLKIGVKADPIAKIFTSDEELLANGGQLPPVDLTSIVTSAAAMLFLVFKVLRLLLLI